MRKLYDVRAKTGEYTDREGNKKGRYVDVGVILENDNGPFMVMEKTFNPAGIEGRDGKISLSLFAPRDRDERPRQPAQDYNAPLEDSIPF